MVRRSKKRRRNQVSSLELRVQEWLKRANIAARKQYPIGRCHVDLFIEPDLVIEINGCHWHRCPQCRPAVTVQNRRALGKDHRRYLFLLNSGYRLLILWEHELQPEHEAQAIQKIREQITKGRTK